MITIDEATYLLSSDLVSELYLPHSYLSMDHIQYLLHLHNWMIVPSAIDGWIIVRKRIICQD